MVCTTSPGRCLPVPASVHISITGKCNLRCSYCSHFGNDWDHAGDLSTQEWLTFFEELASLGVLKVILSGGEAFSRKDLLQLLDGIVRNRMRFKILSNGALIRDEAAAYIAATGRCDAVQISLDGAGPAAHDVARGAGAFVSAIAGLKTLLRHQIPATVRYTIHPHNIDDLEPAAALLLLSPPAPAPCRRRCRGRAAV